MIDNNQWPLFKWNHTKTIEEVTELNTHNFDISTKMENQNKKQKLVKCVTHELNYNR